MKNFKWRVLLACVGVIAATFTVSSSVAVGAAPANLVQNGSFESGYPGDNVCGSWWYGVGYGCNPSASTIPGWTVGGGGVDWHTTHGDGEPVAQDGSHLVDLNSTYGDARGSISQSIATTAGAQYSLSFSYTAHSSCAPNPSPMSVTAGSNSAVFTAPNPTQFTQTPWRLGSLAFTASASSTTIAFESNLDDVCGGVLVDNVSVEQAVAPLAIQIPVSTIVEGPLGSEHVLGSLDIPEALRGTVCSVGITGLNNESQREGTDLVLRSTTESVTLPNVESATNLGVHIDGQITLTDKLTLSVILGAYLDHGAFSGGAAVVVTCPAPPAEVPIVVSPVPLPPPPVAAVPVAPVPVAPVPVAVTPPFTG